jgi:acetyl esterase/lipase
MKSHILLSSPLFALVLLATATAAQRDFPVSATASQADVYPDRVTRFEGGVSSLADVTYSVLPGYRPLVLDLYLPPGKATHPLVVYVHGGGWVGGNTRHSGALTDFPRALAQLASEGFTVASVEYRLSSEAPFPAQLQDLRAALRYLRANAAMYRIEPDKVAIWGGSAGGQLSALAALSCGNHKLDPVMKDSPPAGSECVQGAVIWYGIFDFAPMAARPEAAVTAFLGCKENCREAIRLASPITYLDSKDPPFLLVHGEQDRTVNVSQSRNFEAAARKLGLKVRSIYIPGVDHSFVGQSPDVTRKATLEATNATFDFFHELFPENHP